MDGALVSMRLVIEYLDGTKDITGVLDNVETWEEFNKMFSGGPVHSMTVPKSDVGMMWIPGSAIKKIYEYVPGQEPIKVKRIPKWSSK
jgi:hypothetical protein